MGCEQPKIVAHPPIIADNATKTAANRRQPLKPSLNLAIINPPVKFPMIVDVMMEAAENKHIPLDPYYVVQREKLS